MSHLTIRPSFMELHLLPTLTTLIPIQATSQERRWHGARELHWVPPPGVLGVATGAIGAIALGTTATGTSITTIISIGTTTIQSTGTLTAGKLAKATRGSTIRNTGEMHPMETGKRPLSTVARVADRMAHGLVAERDLVQVVLARPLVIVPAAELGPQTVPAVALVI